MSSDCSGLMKEKRSFLKNESGNFWPVKSRNFGFGSNSSIWLVPPAKKMKMQFFARGRNRAGLGARGWAGTFSFASKESLLSKEAKATEPRPLAALVRKRLRVRSGLEGKN